MATSPRPGWDVPGDPLPESRFIEPDDRCPDPRRWSSTDGDSTELEVTELIVGLVRGLQPRLVVETGAAFGQTTRAIAGALARNGHGQLVAYEIDEERRAEVAAAVRLVSTCEVTIAEGSLEADLAGLPPIDLAFLDSFYETRVPEFLHLHRWMRDGTIVAFHDSAPGRGGHRIEGGLSLRDQIERDLVARGMLRCIDLPTPRGLTLAEVL